MDLSRVSRLWLVGAAVIGVLLLACGGGDDKKNSSSSGSSASSGSASAPADAAPPDKQIIRLRLNGEPKSIDPQLANFDVEISIAKNVFSPLFNYDENLNVIPDLAQELPTLDNGGISRDGKTYTIKLRDAEFSNGRKITAQDVVYSLGRELDPTVASPYASNYYSIAGAEEYNGAFGTKAAPKTPSPADLQKLHDALGLQAKDDKTVVITLTGPSASILQQLAIWPSSVVPKEVIEKFGNKWTEAGNLVGSGPFLLKEWAHNDHITLVANPKWHRGQAILQQVQIKIIQEDAPTYASYLTDDLDTSVVPPANRREVATKGSPLNSQLVRKSELSTFALEFNNQEKPWDNAKVRMAFGTALDRKALIEGVFQGVGVPTTSWVPPGMPGYNANVGKKYEYDPAKAKQLLSDAGYPNGQGLPKITMIITASDTNRLVGQFMQEQFRKNLNIDIAVEYLDSATYQSRFTKGQFNMVLGGWGADWPYPDNWFDEQFTKNGSNNQYQFFDPKVDDLIAKAKQEGDSKKRLDLYDQVHKIVIDDDAGIVPVYNREVFTLVKPRVKNLIITGLDAGIRGDSNLYRTYIAK